MNQFLQKKTDEILRNEELKRLAKSKLNHISEFSFFDTKGELSSIKKILPELQRSINMENSERIKELCILVNKRLKIIFNQF